MNEEIQALVEGLNKPQKTVSPKYLYDEAGSQLFDRITEQPEYYPTGAELEIMRENVDDMTSLIGERASLIEFGSGSSLKTRILLEHLENLAAYVPVDISEDHLLSSAARIQSEFPDIDVRPVVADFTHSFALPTPSVMPVKNVVYFPGSTIGNFEHDAAMDLLHVMHGEAGENGALLIGVDLQKDAQIINRAYNDSAGVTAAFNLNMLRHLNSRYGANFDLDAFEHRAVYDAGKGRVVIELVSQRDQAFTVAGADFDIANGETILTEYSHKYTMESFARMAEDAGFRIAKVWTDKKGLFSVQYCVRN